MALTRLTQIKGSVVRDFTQKVLSLVTGNSFTTKAGVGDKYLMVGGKPLVLQEPVSTAGFVSSIDWDEYSLMIANTKYLFRHARGDNDVLSINMFMDGLQGGSDITDAAKRAQVFAKGEPVFYPSFKEGLYLRDTVLPKSHGFNIWGYDSTVHLDTVGCFVWQQLGSVAASSIFSVKGINTKVDKDKVKVPAHLFNCHSGSDIVFDYNTCEGARGNTLNITNNVSIKSVSYNQLTDCIKNHFGLEGIGAGTSDRGLQEVKSGIVTCNKLDHTDEENGIYIGNAIQQLVITENIIKDCGDSGIEFGGIDGEYGGRYSIISNNLCVGGGHFKPGAAFLLANAGHVRGTGNVAANWKYGCQIVLGSFDVYFGLTVVNSDITGFLCDGCLDVNVTVTTVGSQNEAIRINGSKNVNIEWTDNSYDKCVIKSNWYNNEEACSNIIKGRTKVAPTLSTKDNNYIGLLYSIKVAGSSKSVSCKADAFNDWISVPLEVYNSLKDKDEVAFNFVSDPKDVPEGLRTNEPYYVKKVASPSSGVYPIRVVSREKFISSNKYVKFESSGGTFNMLVYTNKPSTFSNADTNNYATDLGLELPHNIIRGSSSSDITYTQVKAESRITLQGKSDTGYFGWGLGKTSSMLRCQYLLEFEYKGASSSKSEVVVNSYNNEFDIIPTGARNHMKITLKGTGSWTKQSAVVTFEVGTRTNAYFAFIPKAGQDLFLRNIRFTQIGSEEVTTKVVPDFEPDTSGTSNPVVNKLYPEMYKAGSTFYNTQEELQKVYNGAAWV